MSISAAARDHRHAIGQRDLTIDCSIAERRICLFRRNLKDEQPVPVRSR